jgi:hypothetical protein
MSLLYWLCQINIDIWRIYLTGPVRDHPWSDGACSSRSVQKRSLTWVPIRHVPQRVDHAPSEDTVPANILASLVDEYSKAETELFVRLGNSRLEGKGQALFITENVKIIRPVTDLWYREVAHRHDVRSLA